MERRTTGKSRLGEGFTISTPEYKLPLLVIIKILKYMLSKSWVRIGEKLKYSTLSKRLFEPVASIINDTATVSLVNENLITLKLESIINSLAPSMSNNLFKKIESLYTKPMVLVTIYQSDAKIQLTTIKKLIIRGDIALLQQAKFQQSMASMTQLEYLDYGVIGYSPRVFGCILTQTTTLRKLRAPLTLISKEYLESHPQLDSITIALTMANRVGLTPPILSKLNLVPSLRSLKIELDIDMITLPPTITSFSGKYQSLKHNTELQILSINNRSTSLDYDILVRFPNLRELRLKSDANQSNIEKCKEVRDIFLKLPNLVVIGLLDYINSYEAMEVYYKIVEIYGLKLFKMSHKRSYFEKDLSKWKT